MAPVAFSCLRSPLSSFIRAWTCQVNLALANLRAGNGDAALNAATRLGKLFPDHVNTNSTIAATRSILLRYDALSVRYSRQALTNVCFHQGLLYLHHTFSHDNLSHVHGITPDYDTRHVYGAILHDLPSVFVTYLARSNTAHPHNPSHKS